MIKQKLRVSCEECWGKFGYRKTSVGELCKMAGISTGAFYLFYDSKERLFIDTIDRIQQSYEGLIKQLMPEQPTKYDFANMIKQILHEFEKTPWVLHLQDDLEVILRKMPSDFLEITFQSDMGYFCSMIEKYGIHPNISAELLTSMFYILSLSITKIPVVGKNYSEALDLVVDSIIEKYFD